MMSASGSRPMRPLRHSATSLAGMGNQGQDGSGPRKSDRSCVICHRRKVRCDKQMPCSTCTRTRVLCCYPTGESTRQTQRQPKATIANIATRLVQLERTIITVTTETPTGDADQEVNRPANTPWGSGSRVSAPGFSVGGGEDRQCSETSVDDFIVHNQTTSRYINELLLSKVLEEVSAA